MSINLHDSDGITLSSSNSMYIGAPGISLNAGKVTITGNENVIIDKDGVSTVKVEGTCYTEAAGVVYENGSDRTPNEEFTDDDPMIGMAVAAVLKIATAAIAAAVSGIKSIAGQVPGLSDSGEKADSGGSGSNAGSNIGECGNTQNSNSEKSANDSSDKLNLNKDQPWMKDQPKLELPKNESYIGPANKDVVPIISDELTMTKYDPYMTGFKDGMYVQQRAPDNKYYLGTVKYNANLNMAIFTPLDKQEFDAVNARQNEKELRKLASDFIDWTPFGIAKDIVSFFAGKDIITGEECNRAVLATCIVLPGAFDKGVKTAAKHGDEVVEQVSKHGDDVFEEAMNGLKVNEGVSNAVEELPARVPQTYTTDLSPVTGKGAQARNKAINSIIKEDFKDLNLTHTPEYSPFIRTGIAQEGLGTQIGKRMFSSRANLRDTIVHEELHHRWWERGMYDHHPIGNDEQFYKVIERYKRMRGWN